MQIILRDFQRYAAIQEPTQGDMIKIFLNKTQNEVDKIPLEKFNELVAEISEAISKESKFTPTFKLDGIEYGFIPNLEEITYGENRDLTGYLNDWQTMHLAMAVSFRPITLKKGGKYLIEEYNGTSATAEIMRDCPLDIVQGMNIFFYNLINDLLNCIPKYITTEVVNLAALEASGAVIQKSIPSVKATLLDLMK
jgi:hypothetical protein